MNEQNACPRRRGPYKKSLARRRQILDAAAEVYGSPHGDSGTLRDIADRAGLSTAGVLHHFPSKSAILSNLLDHVAPDLLPLADSGLSGLQKLEELLAFARALNPPQPPIELYCRLRVEAASPSHAAHDSLMRQHSITQVRLAEMIRQLADEGILRHDVDVEDAASSAAAVLDGLALHWLLDRDGPRGAIRLSRFFNLLLVAPLPEIDPVRIMNGTAARMGGI